MTLGKKIRTLREAQGVRQEALAKVAHVDPSYISHLESGRIRNPSYGVLRAIAQLLRVSVDELLREEGLEPRGATNTESMLLQARVLLAEIERKIRQEPQQGVRQIPILGNVPAGPSTYQEEDFKGWELAREPDTAGHPRPYVLLAKGDSLIGDGVNDGDYLYVDPDLSPQEGDIVIARVGGEYTAKHIYHGKKDEVILKPSNPRIPTLTVSELDVVGVVFYSRPPGKQWR